MFLERLLYCILFAAATVKAFAVSVVDYQEKCAYIITVLCLYFIVKYVNRTPKEVFVKRALAYIGILAFCWFIHMPFESDLLFYEQLNAFLFPNLLLASFLYFKYHPDDFKYFQFLGVPLIIAAFWNVQRLSAFANEWTTTVTLQSNSGNLLVALVPFCLVYRNKIIRYALWAVIFIGVCISIKRSAFIIFILCFLFSVIFENEKLRRNKYRIAVWISIGMVVFYLISPNIPVFANLLERLSESAEDHGSGRDQLFLVSLGLEQYSNIFEIIIGHGYKAVAKDIINHSSYIVTCAHNDFTEILYDGGLFAFLFFVSMLKHLFLKVKSIVQDDTSEGYYPIIAISCLIILLVASTLICSFVHFWYYLPMFCVFGGILACGSNSNEKGLL